MNKSSFALDLSKFKVNTMKKAERVVKRVAFEAYNRVTLRTPVDTGRARANWLIGIGELPGGIVASAGGASAFSSTQAAKIGLFKIGDIIYIANNLPYIGKLEYGGYPNPPKHPTGKTVGGYSIQAPQGMVGVTMMELQTVYRKAVVEAQS